MVDELTFEETMDVSNQIYLLISALYYKVECPVCHVVQGLPHKGFRRYFCPHITKEINRMMRPINKKVIALMFAK